MPIAADITDLLAGFRHIRAPSGVTRVQTRLVLAGDGLFSLVAFDAGTGVWREFPRAMLERLVEGTTRAGGPHDAWWQALVDEAQGVLAAAPPWHPTAGDWLMGAGATWWLAGHAVRILALKRDSGIRYASFVYDLLPLLVPEHCEAMLVRSFTQHFTAMCLLADHAICISEAVRGDFHAWQARLLPAVNIPTSVLRLNARFGEPGMAGAAPVGPFVLAVGTVESRKNQLGLLRAWLRLLRLHGPAAVPHLVVVGFHGYLAEQVVQLHEGAPELRRHVDLRASVTDGDLQALYANCLFTVFNSHAEGWGLPVTESLAQGRVPVVADVPSLREAGGAHAIYVPPENVPALADAAWALIQDRPGLAAREAALRATVKLREWRELAEECAGFLGGPAPALPLTRAPLPEHLVVPAGLPPLPELPELGPAQSTMGALLREGDGWSHQEDWGTWATAGGRVALRLPLAAEWRCPVVSMLLVVMSPPGGHTVRARPAGGEWVDLAVAAAGLSELRVDAPWPADGTLVLEFDVGEGVAALPDTRRLGFGMLSLRVVPQLATAPPQNAPVWHAIPQKRGFLARLRLPRGS